MPFNFSFPEYLSHHRTRKNRVSPVSRASPAHMNSPLGPSIIAGPLVTFRQVTEKYRRKYCPQLIFKILESEMLYSMRWLKDRWTIAQKQIITEIISI